MSIVAVLGAGNGGLAATADLSLRGHGVRLFNRSRHVLEAIERRGGIRVQGSLGEHTVKPQETTTDIAKAIEGADTVVVVLPATAHLSVAAELSHHLRPGVPLVLNPGHICGSLSFRKVFMDHGVDPPSIAEFGTLTYVCRTHEEGSIDIFLRTTKVPVAFVPGDDAIAASAAHDLFPDIRPVHPIEAWLHDVNMVLHPPGMILGAAWIEATAGDFRFYSEGVTAGVSAVIERLDGERLSVGRSYGFDLLDLGRAMARLGTADLAAAERGDLKAAVAGGEANRTIKAPSSLEHRYIDEDVAYGLVPFTELARAAGVSTPTADALIELAGTIAGRDLRGEGLNAARLGIEALDAQGVKEVATG